MPYIPVANTVMVEMQQSLAGQFLENTIYVEDAAGWTLGKMNTLGGVFHAWFTTSLAPFLTDDLALNGIKITDLETENSPVLNYSAAFPELGDTVGEALPNNVALCVTFLTALRGRSYRGRNYLAGIIDTSIVNNTWAAGTKTAAQNAYIALAATLTAASQEHVVVSRYANGFARATGVTTPVTSYRAAAYATSQRRRLP